MEKLGLLFNPFAPAASGTFLVDDLWIPKSWEDKLNENLNLLASGKGVKALPIIGEYGSGKSFVLTWLKENYFIKKRILPFIFDNPGLDFYELANKLLRQIGRYEFSKSLWELLIQDSKLLKPQLFKWTFSEWLELIVKEKKKGEAIDEFMQLIKDKGITTDEEIAYRLAYIIVETAEKPFFEYRDFIAGRKGTLVVEKEEAPYFSSIIKILQKTNNVEGVAFLIDEFEEIALQKRLNKKQAHDYLVTLRRLINVSQEENFWIIVSMTPQAEKVSSELEPATWQRFTPKKYKFEIPPFSKSDAKEAIKRRLKRTRPEGFNAGDLFPFPQDFPDFLDESTVSNPRRLMKVCSFIISEAMQMEKITLPIDKIFIKEIEKKLYGELNNVAK
jgi:hypothetical protein